MKNFVKIPKSIYVLCCLMHSITTHAQGLKEKQLSTLSGLGVHYRNFDTTDEKINADFQRIIELEKKRRGRNIAGKIILPLGIIAAGIGAKIISEGNKAHRRAEKNPDGTSVTQEVRYGLSGISGGGLVLLGSSKIVVSTSLLVSAKRKKRKRNRLLSGYGVEDE